MLKGEVELVLARISVWHFKKGKRGEALTELDNILSNLTQQEEGFRGYISMFSLDNENTATILTLWQDQESLNASEKAIFTGKIKKVQELLEGHPQIENFKVFSTELIQRSEKSRGGF